MHPTVTPFKPLNIQYALSSSHEICLIIIHKMSSNVIQAEAITGRLKPTTTIGIYNHLQTLMQSNVVNYFLNPLCHHTINKTTSIYLISINNTLITVIAPHSQLMKFYSLQSAVPDYHRHRVLLKN